MGLIEIAVPNLLGGVSEQPAALRQPGQVTACDNALLHVATGLGRRKGTRHLARLFTGLESVRCVHPIDRSTEERYAMLLGERRVRVFNLTTGVEYPVKVNGTATNAGRGRATTGAPVAYLDPRRPQSPTAVASDEDFVIGTWLSVAGHSATSYVAGRGPFKFGRFESAVTVNADTVASVGNDGAGVVSDIYQVLGTFGERNIVALYVKRAAANAANDVEIALVDNAGLVNFKGARFDIAANGVVTVGALVGTYTADVVATATAEGTDGWYLCVVSVPASLGLPAPGNVGVGGARRLRVRFHTNAATPANKVALLFGARLYDGLESAPTYVFPEPDLFRALTIEDTTFLLNTETTVGALTGSTPGGGTTHGFVFVRGGGQLNTVYTVRIHGTTTHTYTYDTGGVLANAQTDNIVTQLAILINAAGFFAATNFGSTLILANGTENIAAVNAQDSRGDTLMVAFMSPLGMITHFTDLPLTLAVSDAIVKVTGDPERDADDYYVRFQLTNVGSSDGRGTWNECASPGIGLALPSATMPQRVRRLQDDAAGTITGTPYAIYFDVGAVPWDNRLVGDNGSNPAPSFVGQAIKDLFLYRGRLGFLALDHVILSEAGEVFNFFRSTVLQLVDTDPIDVQASSREVVRLRNATPTADNLVLFSDRQEFQLVGDPTLTPATASVPAVRAIPALPQARPVDSGRGVIFARADSAFSGLTEMTLLTDDLNFRFVDITVQAPRFIVGPVQEIDHSALVNLTVARADADGVLYVHQSFHDDQENVLQSALHRWTVTGAPRGMIFLASDLRLVVERAEGWFLESVLAGPDTQENALPIVHLDRRATAAQTIRTYDGGLDRTEIVLPYNIENGATMAVVDAASGLRIPVVSTTTNSVLVSGDVTATALYVGELFETRVSLTQPVIQDQAPRGGLIPRMGRVIAVLRLYLFLADTAFTQVMVAAQGSDPTTEDFAAAGLGTGVLSEGELALYTGDAEFAVIGKSTETDVAVVNGTTFPLFVESARWEVQHHQRAGLA